MFGPWRQDPTTAWLGRYKENGIAGIDGHKKAILNYYEKHYLPLGNSLLVDGITSFEKALEAGINPFISDKSDYPDIEGSYLLAAISYAQLTGETPVGLNVFTCSYGEISADNAQILQEIASQVAGLEYTSTPLDAAKEIK